MSNTPDIDGKIYGRNPKGRLVEITNWQVRSESGTLVAVPLPEDQAGLVLALKEAGYSDSRIYGILHPDDRPEPAPEPPQGAAEFLPAEICFDLDDVGKDQLIAIVEQLIGSELPTLAAMSRRDLAAMIRSLVEKGLLRIEVR